MVHLAFAFRLGSLHIGRAWVGTAFALCWLLSSLCLFSPVAVYAAPDTPTQTLIPLGGYGGAMSAVVVAGDYAYVAQGFRVVVVDVSDADSPHRVGQSELLPNLATSLVITGDILYAALTGTRIAVIDVSDPTDPTVLFFLDLPELVHDLAIAPATGDNFLYVAAGETGLLVFDISTPTQPTLVGTLDTPGDALNLAVAANTLYLADGGGGLRVIDVSDPTTPVEITAVATVDEEIVAVSYAADHIYVADSPNTLRVLNVSDPAQPTQVGDTDTLYTMDDLEVAGDHLYVLMNGGVYIFSTTPTGPTQRETLGLDYFVTDIAVVGEVAFITDSRAGLYIYIIDPPALATVDFPVTAPVVSSEIALLTSLSRATSVVVAGNRAYAADDFTGIAQLDISNLARVTETLRFGVEPRVNQQLALANDTLILDGLYIVPGGENRRLTFHDLANPLAPQSLGGRQVAEQYALASRVATRNGVIYAADDMGFDLDTTVGVMILDADDPTGAPLGVFNPADAPIYIVAAPPGTTWLATPAGGNLWFADLTTPENPQVLGSVPGSYGAVGGSGTWAFAYNYTTSALDVIDLEEPTQPLIVGTLPVSGSAVVSIVAVDNLVWVATRNEGVRVIDVTTPASPQEIAFFNPDILLWSMVVVGNRAFVAADEMGLVVLQLQAPTALEEIQQPTRWRVSLPLLSRE